MANNIKLARKRMGISQMRLAELTRLSTSYIGELELGKKFPSAEKFERISDALGLHPYQLIYEAEDWEVHDKYDEVAALRMELREKMNILLEETIRKHLKD